MGISVIIPTYQEEDHISQTIEEVQKRHLGLVSEILVVDGGSSDATVERAKQTGAEVIDSPRKGRAAQMNEGAGRATSPILYFLHADTIPPAKFDKQIKNAMNKGFKAGCFRLAFDRENWLLSTYSWFTRFDVDAFRFGDQSLFIETECFKEIDGFREDHLLMEDNEIIRRIRKHYSFALLDDEVETSSRSYERAGFLKLQLVFAIIYILYFLGVEQKKLMELRKKFINRV